MVNGMISKLILGFVTLIIGVVLIASIATQGNLVTDKTNMVNESGSISTIVDNAGHINNTNTVAVANAPTSWKQADCPLTDVVILNSSGEVFTVTTDYVVTASTGEIAYQNSTNLLNIAVTDNITSLTYTYCGDDYLNLSWGRTSIDVAMGLFGVAILLISVGIFFSIGKDSGLFNSGF